MIQNLKNFVKIVNTCKNVLNKFDQKKFNFHILLIFLISLIQVINVTSIIPFIAIFFNPEKILENKYIISIFEITNIEIGQLQIYFTLSFLFITFFSFFVNYRIINRNIELAYKFENLIKLSVFKKRLYQNYESQINDGTNKIISIFTQKSHLISSLLNSYFNFLNSIFLIFILFIFLFYINYKVCLIVFAILLLIFILISKKNKDKTNLSSKILNLNQDKITKTFNNSLNHMNEIKLYSLENLFINEFIKSNDLITKSLIANKKIVEIPRITIEYFALIFFVLALFVLNKFYNLVNFIPIIAFIGFSIQRLLPAFNKFYSSVATYEGEKKPIEEIISFLKKITKIKIFKKKNSFINFNEKIEIKNLKFNYKNNTSPIVVEKIIIKKNSKVAIIGKTGIGKSTIANIISGVLETNGELLVDNKKITHSNVHKWQEKISNVPQNIFLQNASIFKNITLGFNKNKIENRKLSKILKLSGVSQFVKNKYKFKSFKVGDNGSKISGGQKQRVAIARSLFRSPEVLIFDEATNQLDKNTEKKILSEILKMKKLTFIFITHNKNILNKFDQVIDLDNKKTNYKKILIKPNV